MNHIYKVIWNKAKHCYTVVSEIAKNHSTSSVTKKKVSIAAILVAGMLSGFSPMVSGAADTIVYDQKGTSLKSTNSNGVGENAIALGKGASAVKNSIAIGNGAYTQDGTLTKGQSVALGNGAVTGAKSTSIGNNAIGGREGTITIGANAKNEALYSTVVGTDSKITSDGTAYMLDLGFLGKKPVIVQGAVSTSFGAHNTITNTGKVYSGVANSIIGSVNTVTNSNGVTIQGTGNTVTGAYKDMNLSPSDWSKLFFGGDYSVLKEKESGAIAIIGGANTISNQTSSTVIGYGNTLEGGENSTGVLTAGSQNTLTNVSNSLVMGDNNTLEDRENVISLGNNNTVDANDAVAIGNGTTVSAESGVAIGVGSVAVRVADSEKGKHGLFVPANIPKEEESTWASTRGAVSVGDTANNITRQITDVAAGNEDTDAVNVAQLKQVASQAEKANQGWNLSTNGAAATNVAPGGYVDFSGDDNVSVSNKETKVTVALNKDVKLHSATFEDTVINANGLTIGGGTSGLEFSKNRVSVGGQQIHDVADGKDDMDAVNVSQLKKQAAASKTTVSDGTNTTVTSTVAEDGHTDYKVNLNKDLTGIESISNGSKGQSKIVLNEAYTGMAYGETNVVLMDNGVYLNGKVNVDKAGQIHNVTAGTADEDAVNVSQLNKQAAASKTTVSDGTNTTVTSTVAEDGHTDYKVNLNKDLTGIESISNGSKGQSKIVLNEAYTGMAYGETNVVLMDNGVYLNGKVNVDKAGQIHNVTAGTADEDAVNVSQLNKQAAASKTTVSDGTNTTVTSTVAEDGHTDYKVNLNKDLTGIESMTNGLSSIRMGNGGTVTINNRVTIDQSGKISGVAAGEVKEGSTDAVNGSQLKGVENKADKNAENIQKNTEAIAKNTADISKNAEAISKNTENIKNNSKAIAENAKNIQKNTEAIAKNTADISKNTEAIGKLDERVTSVEEVAKKHTTVSTDDKNVQISEDTNKDGGKDYKVSLNKDLNLSSVTTGDTKMDTNGVTVKDVSLTKDGLSIGNKTYVSNKGLNANDQKVTNVAAGDISEKSTDAVNGSQLFATNQQVAQNVQSISKLGNRINKVGAGAAALAALHPLDFDPDDKWDIAAGYGNYNGENAAAIGAYYRPNEDTMFSVGGSFGNGENMVNAGVSLKLGQGNHVSTSKVAMAKEIKDLRKELEGLKSALLDVNAGKKLDTSKLQLFPDVPKNHWAYEYVSTLKGNGVLTGYPDGEFKGDRPMTRYEFATMLYKAMLEGATLSDKILKEFAPELERFTVDTVHQDKDGKPTVERVRTVKAEK